MKCRSCSGAIAPLLNLGMQPLANHLLVGMQESLRYPLDLRICETCHLGQLADLISPKMMFCEYVYYTSVSGPSVASAKSLVERTVGEISVERDTRVVEIGSNDGYLLQFYRRWGIQVLGIDPARGPANDAACVGIPTIQDFFTESLARQLAIRVGHADIIHANNVLAHVPDLNDFVAGLAVLLAPNGTCFVEVPYLGDLLRKCEFDTIYHEHVYYFSFQALTSLFQRHGLFIKDVERLSAHGGSLRLRITHRPSTFLMPEDLALDCASLQSRVDHIAHDLKSTLTGIRTAGKRIWGFGAAAKATVMLNHCGITSALIDAVADETPTKIGKFIPGTGSVPIRHPDAWLAAAPDYTCIFAWNFADVIVKRYADSYHGGFFTPYSLPGSAKETIT